MNPALQSKVNTTGHVNCSSLLAWGLSTLQAIASDLRISVIRMLSMRKPGPFSSDFTASSYNNLRYDTMTYKLLS